MDAQQAGAAPVLTKRELFAIAALQGMLAHSTRYRPREDDEWQGWHRAIAEEAFDIADEMIRAGA